MEKVKEIVYNILTENLKDIDISDEKIEEISNNIVKNIKLENAFIIKTEELKENYIKPFSFPTK